MLFFFFLFNLTPINMLLGGCDSLSSKSLLTLHTRIFMILPVSISKAGRPSDGGRNFPQVRLLFGSSAANLGQDSGTTSRGSDDSSSQVTTSYQYSVQYQDRPEPLLETTRVMNIQVRRVMDREVVVK